MDVMLKITDEQYDKFYVTSDTHFNHNKDFIYDKRGYSNATTMTNDMIDIINQTVGESGILLHLGDFCLNTTLQQYINILSRLKISELWMLNGNHNNPHRFFDHNSVSYINYKILRLNDYFTFRHKRKIFTCLHYPMAIWDGMGIGAMHLCGHSHGSYKLSRPEDGTHKILDCGWCIHKKPLSLKVIENIMLKKGISNLHHA